MLVNMPKLCYIRWHDAHFFNEECKLDNVGDEPMELHEVGYLLKKTKEHYVLGMEWCKDMETSRYTLIIPRVNVKEIRLFTLPKARRS